MTEVKQIYKCNVCGNIVESVHAGIGDLVCCGQPMVLQKENTVDAVQEKHVPVIKKTDNGYKVKVGSLFHPMEDSHYIEWIELIANNRVYRKALKPGHKAEVEFCIKAEKVKAREYCNLHGLWQADFS